MTTLCRPCGAELLMVERSRGYALAALVLHPWLPYWRTFGACRESLMPHLRCGAESLLMGVKRLYAETHS